MTPFRTSVGLCMLLIASSCLYTAGMVLNDVFDREQDRRERPQRPIPSGRVAVSTAVWLSIALLIVGIGCGAGDWSSCACIGGRCRLPLALVVFIVAYDAHFKHTAGGPLAMGVCRMLNVLLGMSVSHAAAVDGESDDCRRHWIVYRRA